jgi:maltoporin
MPFKPLLFFCTLLFACNNNTAKTPASSNIATADNTDKLNNKNLYPTIKKIDLPEGYHRTAADTNSFTTWLRDVPLKENKTVYLFDGRQKTNQQAQFAVLDISVGNKNLQQCADAVMRLRAEYIFAKSRFTDILFSDNNNTSYAFTKPYTKEHLSNYLQQVFGRCGSASLSKQLNVVNNFANITAGDVIIRGGFPGHAVIVVDVAENSNGEKIFMLAQSYMPAQDIHILVNPLNKNISPWYSVTDKNTITTPEYLFNTMELKRW